MRPIHMICLLIALGAIALAGPTWRREQPPFTEDKAPLVIALDLSQTMDAIDLDPTRIERAKLKLRDLLKVRNGARTALFVYSGTTHMVLPFTMDNSLFDLYLDSLTTSLMPGQGKDSAKALHTIEDFLKDETIPGTILFVTDGIEPHAIAAFRQFTARNTDKDDILVMGVGTSQGGPVRASGNRLLDDSSGRRVFSKLDVSALRSLSSIGVPATTLTLNDDDIRWIQRRVQHHLDAVQQNNIKTRWVNEGYWLTIPIAAIAVFWFRRGWTVRWTSTALTALILLPSPVGNANFSWLDLWLTPDQQGRYYMEKREYQKAAGRYQDSMWKGLALIRAGDDEDALNAFALSDSAESWYNQGNALAHLGRYSEAAQAYQRALAQRPAWQEAKDNLELVRSFIPKEKKKEDEEGTEIPPNLPPDQIKFDEKGKGGKRAKIQQMKVDPTKMADIWMRNIQTTPADFLRLRFAIQAAQERNR
ncbi:VWA domain-containing protein [Granulicella sp. L60]|uniref:VWA domain-containing protein n=1 Tax=Granulicella sp. L60 TaxID=1641866 RepID=UPI00131E01EB|nr:VWA domain-containing protein [Granulicella sp. L60]